jgi:hypothetical protein
VTQPPAGRGRAEPSAAARDGVLRHALGGWIVFRYAAIRTITDWPSALTDVDTVLYLPEAVYAPVWMPITISLAMRTS